MAQLMAARVNALGVARPLTESEVQEFWTCASGTPHEWLFRRTPAGEGMYRCRSCGTTVEKRDLKRVTDLS